ncbi:DUF4132 domain-containing protein [Deinococcus malanensis]|uniref:DUF4132 domain-containing protein n=1 Tax=Deinococcus malanensis TaxID=1706855 RepID=UPI00362BD57D
MTVTDTHTEALSFFQDFIIAAEQRHRQTGTLYGTKPAELLPAARLNLPPPVAVQVVNLALHDVCHGSRHWSFKSAEEKLIVQLARRHLPYTAEDAREIVGRLARYPNPAVLPTRALLTSLLVGLGRDMLLSSARSELEALASALGHHTWADARKLHSFVAELLHDGPSGLHLDADVWGARVLPLLDTLSEPVQSAWTNLLLHCASASGNTPTKAWLTEAQTRMDALGDEHFLPLATTWLAQAVPGGRAVPPAEQAVPARHPDLYAARNADLLRGLAWVSGLVPDAHLAAVLGDLALAGYRKVSGHGPRSVKVAGACVAALQRLPGLLGAGQLLRVAQGVQQPSYRASLDRVIEDIAQRLGLSREDLEEIGVPTFDLTDVGQRDVLLGDTTAEVRADGRTVQLTWRNEKGQPVKTVPARVKREFAAELKDLKASAKALEKVLGAQRDRLDGLMMLDRTWTFDTWRDRYLDHPVVGVLARRLLWTIDGRSVLWHQGVLRDQGGEDVTPSPSAEVKLWHPVLAPLEEVRAWRERLEDWQMVQPFKQAHREVYLLTDAERATRVYSNRFAAHVVRQHQFNALCAARGWRNSLRLMVDDEYPRPPGNYLNTVCAPSTGSKASATSTGRIRTRRGRTCVWSPIRCVSTVWTPRGIPRMRAEGVWADLALPESGGTGPAGGRAAAGAERSVAGCRPVRGGRVRGERPDMAGWRAAGAVPAVLAALQLRGSGRDGADPPGGAGPAAATPEDRGTV